MIEMNFVPSFLRMSPFYISSIMDCLGWMIYPSPTFTWKFHTAVAMTVLICITAMPFLRHILGNELKAKNL